MRKKSLRILFYFKNLVMPPARLERATHSLEGCCSIQLSYGSIIKERIKILATRNF